MSRDEIGEDLAKSKISSQLDLKTKRDKADYVLDNSGTKQQLEQQVKSLAETLQPSFKYIAMYHMLRALLISAIPLKTTVFQLVLILFGLYIVLSLFELLRFISSK